MGTEAKQMTELEAEFRDAPPSVRMAHDLAPYPPGRDPEANGDGGADPEDGDEPGDEPEPPTEHEPEQPEPVDEEATEDPDAAGTTEDGGGEDGDDTRPSGSSKGDGLGLGIDDPDADPFTDVPYEESVRALAADGLYDGDPIAPWGVSGRPSVPWDLRTAPVEPGGDLRFVKANMRLTTWRDAILGRKPLPDSGLPSTTRYVLLAASVWMNRDGSSAWPSARKLARACNVSDSTVRKHLRVAEEGGWICRVQLTRSDGGKGWSTNLLVPGIPAGTLPQDGEVDG